MKIIEPIGKGTKGGKQRQSDALPKAKASVSGYYRNERTSSSKRNRSNTLAEQTNSDLDFDIETIAFEDKNKESGKKSYKDLLHKGIHLLSMREHSVQELFTKLNTKEPKVEIVDQVVGFLSENDYVSDTRFTEAFVRAKANKGQGPIKIRAQLKNKGVTDHTIDEFLDLISAKWFDIAQIEYDKKYGELAVTDYNEWSKRARFLQSRGFTMDHIHSVVPQLNFD